MCEESVIERDFLSHNPRKGKVTKSAHGCARIDAISRRSFRSSEVACDKNLTSSELRVAGTAQTSRMPKFTQSLETRGCF